MLRRATGAEEDAVAESKFVMVVEVDTPAVYETSAATLEADTDRVEPGDTA